jgi:dynein heavy chain 1
MQQLEDDDELAYSAEEGLSQTHAQEGDGRPSWMRTLHNSAFTWLQLLPKSLQVIL